MQAPNFYAEVPPAPPGLEWWSYSPGVPPLPNPQDVLGPNYSTYYWRYNSDYSAQSYTFSQLDKVRLTLDLISCCGQVVAENLWAAPPEVGD